MKTKERADKLLVGRGLAETREKAQALILAGLVQSEGRPVRKAGELLSPEAPLDLKSRLPFVGRGGLKLEEALDRFGVDVAGVVAADIGSSTGGFTDCLLQRGARKVYAVDVDTRQLDWRLRGDARVVLVEKNARALQPSDFAESPEVATMDVSFISILKIVPALRGISGTRVLLALVKPQFEAGRRDVGKKGIVRDPGVWGRVLTDVVAGVEREGFKTRGLIRVSTRGQKGNVEFFGHFVREEAAGNPDAVRAWIKEAVNDEKDEKSRDRHQAPRS
jgi:23S rRNA (cytidine1920-2'-O)/16S rRNA (cytidine1409-2'-O)-methyltransferase